MNIGSRVRLICDVAPYPLGLFPAGTTGIVAEVNPDAHTGNPIAYVKLEKRFDCLDDWDNVLQVFRSEDETSEVTPEAFRQIDEDEECDSEPDPRRCQHRDDGRGQCIDCGAFLDTWND